MKKALMLMLGGTILLTMLFMFTWLGTVAFSVFTLFPFFREGALESGKLSQPLANFLAAGFTTTVVYGSYNLFSFNKVKRHKGLMVLGLCFTAFYLLTFSLS